MPHPSLVRRHALAAALSACLAPLLAPAPLAAQTPLRTAPPSTTRGPERTLLQDLAEEYPADRLNTRPNPSDLIGTWGACAAATRPDSVFLIAGGGGLRGPIQLESWRRDASPFGPRPPRWTVVQTIGFTRETPDTTGFAVRDVLCGGPGSSPQLLLEHAGYVASLDVSHASTADRGEVPDTTITAPKVYVRAPNGGLEPAVVVDGYAVTSHQALRLVGYHATVEARTAAAGRAAGAARAAEARRLATIRAQSWGSDDKAAVIARKVHVGMTAAMVRLAWGAPHRVNATLTARGRREQWVYGGSYVYVDNGIVTAIQTSR